LLRGNVNLGFQKRNRALCALNFKKQLLIKTFMNVFGMAGYGKLGSYGVVVKSRS
jgi:hypothetical protein